MTKDAIREHECQHGCRVVSVCRNPGGMKLLYCMPRSGRQNFIVDVVGGRTFIAETLPDKHDILAPGQNPQGRWTDPQELHFLVTEPTPRLKRTRIQQAQLGWIPWLP